MGKQILIIDDSPSIRQSLRYLIETAGYEVAEAANGKEALKKLQSATKLVITDINMPEMNGVEFVKAVRMGDIATKTIPIIILTTESADDMKLKGKDAGATAWIVKPFSPELIITTIKKIIG